MVMMEQELLSKKELLERYGISYGALYRWKRKGLIPEEWFLRKATVTGQETFFPKALICERVELIQSQKDECSLDELASRLKGETGAHTTLVLQTAFGEKTYDLRDIRGVFLEKDGERREVTQELFKS